MTCLANCQQRGFAVLEPGHRVEEIARGVVRCEPRLDAPSVFRAYQHRATSDSLPGEDIRRVVADKVALLQRKRKVRRGLEEQARLGLAAGATFVRPMRAAQHSVDTTAVTLDDARHPSVDVIDPRPGHSASMDDRLIRDDNRRPPGAMQPSQRLK